MILLIGKIFLKLRYNDRNRKMKEAEQQDMCILMCNMMSQYEFECDKFDDECLYPMAAEKEYADSQFPLDVCTMKELQEKDTHIQKLIKKTNTRFL